LQLATIWDVLPDVFCSCVRDFYGPCPYGRYIVYFGCYCWAQRRKKRCKVEV